MKITPEIQAQLDQQKANCIFCKILKGEIESHKVYSDDVITGVLDINPAVPGHCVFMPNEHYPIMPYLPPKTFKHLFGMMGKLLGAAKKSMLVTGGTIFIANGGVAGQQSPHFLIHLFPRESGDSINEFQFETKHVEQNEQVVRMLSQNIPIMMKNHFGRNPAKWHNGKISRASWLQDSKPIYEDEKAFVMLAKKPQSSGHLVIFSQEEEQDVENLSKESVAHLFYVASFCATAVFEGLGAHGSNIILKSGMYGDQNCLEIHVLPRFSGDELKLMWTPLKNKPNLNQIKSKLSDKMDMIQYSEEKKEEEEVVFYSEKKMSDSEREILDAINSVIE